MQLEELNAIFTEEYPGFTGFRHDPCTIDVIGSLNGKEIRLFDYDAWVNCGQAAMFAEIRMQLNGASFGRDGQLVARLPAKELHREGK